MMKKHTAGKWTQEEERDILKACTNEKGELDISHALMLAYTAGRRDEEKAQAQS